MQVRRQPSPDGARLMLETRRENAVQKMLVMKQMNAGRGGAQPLPASMVDDSVPELRREAEVAESYSSTSRQRAGAFGLSAGVGMDLRWDGTWGSEPTR